MAWVTEAMESRTPGDRRVAIVTGAAGALGTAMCERFVQDGHRVVVADLALEAFGHDVERRSHLSCLGVGPEVLPGRGGEGLDPVQTALAGVLLRDDLDLEPREPRLDAFEVGELVLGRRAELLGDAGPARRQDQLHPPSSRPLPAPPFQARYGPAPG